MENYEIIIESPRDSKEKYDFDPANNSFFLKKLLPLGMSFPYDFGFIPGTKGDDGDPLDAMVISEFKTFTGCHVSCRLIGAVKAEQEEDKKIIRNNRFFFIPITSKVFDHIKDINDFSPSQLKELLFFFITYNEEEGKHFNPLKIISEHKAGKLIKKGSEGN
jgi:inorganic pyrophosphatase